MQDTRNLVEKRTEIFWGISFMWNGRAESTISTGDAIEWLAGVSSQMRQELRIAHTTRKLLDEIVAGTSPISEVSASVLPFEQPRPKKKARKQKQA